MKNQKQVFAVYETDFNHSKNSMVLIGIFTNKDKLNAAIKKIIKDDLTNNEEGKGKKEIEEYIEWNYQFFLENNQTRGLASFEINVKQFTLNQIIE